MQMWTKIISSFVFNFVYWLVNPLSSMPLQKRRDLSNKLRTYFECPRYLVFINFMVVIYWQLFVNCRSDFFKDELSVIHLTKWRTNNSSLNNTIWYNQLYMCRLNKQKWYYWVQHSGWVCLEVKNFEIIPNTWIVFMQPASSRSKDGFNFH